MAHIFFKRLEKRRSTQSLILFNDFLNLEELEKWVGNSISRQTNNFQQPYSLPASSVYSAYNVYNSYPVYYTPFTSSNFPQMNPAWPYSNDLWSSWTNPQSFWPLPISYATPSWLSQIYPRNSFIVPSISPSLVVRTSPSPTAITTPSPPSTTSPTQNTNTDPFWLSPSYAPGTWYGLIKRSNLKA